MKNQVFISEFFKFRNKESEIKTCFKIMRILILDKISKNGIEMMKKEGIEVDLKTDFPRENIGEIIDDYEGVVVRSKTKLTREILEKTKNLKFIIRAGVGLDNIDVQTAREKGLDIFNTPQASSVAVAELTIGFLLALSRSIPQATAFLRAEKWEKEKFEGQEVYGKTLGIIGLGRIGKEVAKRARALGMRVLGSDPFVKEVSEVEMVALDSLLKNSDYITLHTPLNEKTRNLINEKTIKEMKDGVFIINSARGGLIDENALYEALKSGKVRGAGFDVFELEPPLKNKLLSLENFICTPHIGALTLEAQWKIGAEVAKIAIEYKPSFM